MADMACVLTVCWLQGQGDDGRAEDKAGAG